MLKHAACTYNLPWNNKVLLICLPRKKDDFHVKILWKTFLPYYYNLCVLKVRFYRHFFRFTQNVSIPFSVCVHWWLPHHTSISCKMDQPWSWHYLWCHRSGSKDCPLTIRGLLNNSQISGSLTLPFKDPCVRPYIKVSFKKVTRESQLFETWGHHLLQSDVKRDFHTKKLKSWSQNFEIFKSSLKKQKQKHKHLILRFL